ncbi:MAG: EI24 domain-containing protein [Burkholderiaceae bacterium]|nr:EI24 domain-containing protein [Burkholderiaceae bacterium]
MLSGMQLLFASFSRALLYCLYPQVIILSILPLVLMAGAAFGLGYFFWEPALDMVRSGLDSYEVLGTLWAWLQSLGVGNLKTVVAPLIVIFVVTPLLVLICLLVVAAMMTPAMTELVAKRRYPDLKREQGGSVVVSIWWSLSSAVLAIVAMVVSIPLWLIPPLILIVPPLIWGWLTYRVMAYDALSTHASKSERRQIFRDHRASLLFIGLVSGSLGAAPSLVWASGALFAAAFVFLVPVAIWMYTLIFAFSSLWFAHYCLGALQALRADQGTLAASVCVVLPVPNDVEPQALPLPDDPGPRQSP